MGLLSDDDQDDLEIGQSRDRTPAHPDDSFDELNWGDQDLDHDPSMPVGDERVGTCKTATDQPSIETTLVAPTAHERTPLIRKAVSFSDTPHPRCLSNSEGASPFNDIHSTSHNLPTYQPSDRAHSPTRRNSSSSSTKDYKHNYGGKSTYGQTVFLILMSWVARTQVNQQLFNSIAILVGVGMLSEPLAFAYAGWIGGTILIFSYGFIACYTYVGMAILD